MGQVENTNKHKGQERNPATPLWIKTAPLCGAAPTLSTKCFPQRENRVLGGTGEWWGLSAGGGTGRSRHGGRVGAGLSAALCSAYVASLSYVKAEVLVFSPWVTSPAGRQCLDL